MSCHDAGVDQGVDQPTHHGGSLSMARRVEAEATVALPLFVVAGLRAVGGGMQLRVCLGVCGVYVG